MKKELSFNLTCFYDTDLSRIFLVDGNFKRNKIMFYLDTTSFEWQIVEASKQEIIRDFSEQTTTPNGINNKYFYEDGAIYSWTPNGSKHKGFECDEKEAEQFLYEQAANHKDIKFFETFNELKEYVEQLIENFEEEEEEQLADHLRKILNAFQSSLK